MLFMNFRCLYDEIDDYNFKSNMRQKYLKLYLENISTAILKISRHKLYVSGFFSNHMSPQLYASMLSTVIENRYTLLLQSGIGANLVDANKSSHYMKVFAKEYNGDFIPIVEGFVVQKSQIEAVDFTRLKKEIEILQNSSNRTSLTLFSLRYFLDRKLFYPYVAEYVKK